MARIVQATSASDIAVARSLFEEYARSLDFDLCFQGFERELAELPGRYAPPSGRILLAQNGDAFVGCIALRALDPRICEMKRLYVQPTSAGKGIGRLLANALIGEARLVGYDTMRLDTIPAMRAAITLYESLGFRDIPPYTENPIPGARFLELALAC